MKAIDTGNNEPITIWWIKRDFRLYDNEVLAEAINSGNSILPLFVFEPNIMQSSDFSAMHLYAQISASSDLRLRLQAIGGDIMFDTAEITQVLISLSEKFVIQRVISHEETGNDVSFTRDKRLAKYLKENQIEWIELPQNAVIRRLKTRNHRQPIIKARLFNTTPISAPKNIPQSKNLKEFAASTMLPNVSDFFSKESTINIQFEQLQAVSESAAQQCLRSFLEVRGKGYSGGISSPNTAFKHGSRLSPHIAWGTISLRTIFDETEKRYKAIPDKQFSKQQIKQWQRSLRAFQSRLHWHCHFIQRLESAPSMEFEPLNSAYRTIQYEDSGELLAAWCAGKTGFPLVDACMRCLNAIGFLNFRMRAFVVSFAVFGLHLDWRTIHPHLARVFYDYEPGIHLAQLQMQAGIVGINTIRVYSPTKQLMEQDPQCQFVKQWIPELRAFAVQDIQSYESWPLEDYPRPIIDFNQRSKSMKDQVFAIRKSESGRVQSKKVLELHGSKKSIGKKSTQKEEKHPQLDLF